MIVSLKLSKMCIAIFNNKSVFNVCNECQLLYVDYKYSNLKHTLLYICDPVKHVTS